jgi:hypothetical protein
MNRYKVIISIFGVKIPVRRVKAESPEDAKEIVRKLVISKMQLESSYEIPTDKDVAEWLGIKY